MSQKDIDFVRRANVAVIYRASVWKENFRNILQCAESIKSIILWASFISRNFSKFLSVRFLASVTSSCRASATRDQESEISVLTMNTGPSCDVNNVFNNVPRSPVGSIVARLVRSPRGV